MSLRVSGLRYKDNHEVDEETPLFPNEEVLHRLNPTRTPLPTVQISILLTAWLAESTLSHSISPYLNQVQVAVGPTYWY